MRSLASWLCGMLIATGLIFAVGTASASPASTALIAPDLKSSTGSGGHWPWTVLPLSSSLLEALGRLPLPSLVPSLQLVLGYDEMSRRFQSAGSWQRLRTRHRQWDRRQGWSLQQAYSRSNCGRSFCSRTPGESRERTNLVVIRPDHAFGSQDARRETWPVCGPT